MSCENGLKIFPQFGLRSACSSIVNSGIFTRILFSPIALKNIFAMLKIYAWGMIYLTTERFCAFSGVLLSRNLADVKLCENKTLAKFSEFTVHINLALYLVTR